MQNTPSILQTPEINPFQFDKPVNNIGSTVNLFRGDVNFSMPLVSLNGGGGLDINVSALYQSNVHDIATTRNLEAPTSVLGLGWQLPIASIEVDIQNSGNPQSHKYYFVQQEARNQLYRVDTPWLRGMIDKALAIDLDAGSFSPSLFAALLEEGLRISDSTDIIVVKQGSQWTLSDPTYELVLDLVLEGEDASIQILDGGDAYELQSFDFSRIRYYQRFERWEITAKNGLTQVFGGNLSTDNGIKTSKYNAIQWGVRIGNYTGSTSLTHSSEKPNQRLQEQYPKAWNLVGSYSCWNDQVNFQYTQVTQQVGDCTGLPYTKEIYIDQITGVYGDTVHFIYQDKAYDSHNAESPREYADPYKAIPNNEPDSYQSCYPTQFLDQILVKNPHGQKLYQLDFEYKLARYTEYFSHHPFLNGDTFKRTLVSIKKSLASGETLPPVTMEYYPSDGTNPNPGAMKSITYAEGSTATYTYSSYELKNCDRSLTLNNPITGSIPRVWFGNDYAVVTWYNQGRLYLSIYTWVGRWQKWEPSESSINTYLDLETFDCEIQSDFFVLHYRSGNQESYTIRTFHKNPSIIGAWLEHPQNPITVESRDCVITSGDHFFVVLDQINSELTTYTWNGLLKNWESSTLPNFKPADPRKQAYFITSTGNVITLLSYDKLSAPGYKKSQLSLYYLDPIGTWKTGDCRKAPEILIADPDEKNNFNGSPLNWATVFTYITRDLGSEISYNIGIYAWDTDYQFLEPVTNAYSLDKSQPSNQVTVPYIAQCTSIGMICSGPHLLRFNGEKWLQNDHLKIQNKIEDGSLFWFSSGEDLVIKSENTPDDILTMVQVYDPNTQINQWQENPITLLHQRPTGNRLTEYFPSSSQDWLTSNTALYQRGTSTNWVTPLETYKQKPARNLPNGIDTTTILNQAPYFMVYLSKSQDGKTILGTSLITIKNGVTNNPEPLRQRYFSLVNNQGQFVNNTTGKMPGKGSSFMTYLPLDADFEKASSITLYQYLGISMSEPVKSYPATKVEVSNGYQSSETHFVFDPDSATCDYHGRVAKFYKTTLYSGANKQDGYTEYQFFNSFDRSDKNLQESSFLDGLPKQKNIYDSNGDPVASSSSEYQVITTVAESPNSSKMRPIFGALVQISKTTSTQEGLESVANLSHNLTSGSVNHQSTSTYNSEGKQECIKKDILFGFETYPKLWYQNNLSASVQTKSRINVDQTGDIITSCSAGTIKDFRQIVHADKNRYRLIPDSFESFVWQGGTGDANFNFQEWSGGIGYSDQWFKLSSITVRSNTGCVLENEAPIGKTQSQVLSSDEAFCIAKFGDASQVGQEAYYYGFEPYENPCIWQLDEHTSIVDTISYTGTRCLSLLPHKMGQPLCLSPSNQNRSYLLSFWAKVASNYQLDQPAGWQIKILEDSTVLKTLEVLIGNSDRWEYYFLEIDLRALTTDRLSLEMTPFNQGGVSVYIDSVNFSPFENPATISVHNPLYHYITENIGPYNCTSRSIHDPLKRIVGQTNNTDRLTQLSSYFLSRQINKTFSPNEPNALYHFQPMGETYFDRFMNNGDYSDHWIPSNPAAWTSKKGNLIHSGNSTDLITFKAPNYQQYYIAQTEVSIDSPLTGTIGMKVGSDLNLFWDSSKAHWILEDIKNGHQEPPFSAPSPEGQWTLVLSQEIVLFLVGGRLAFSYHPQQMVSGTLSLLATNEVSFHYFMIGLDPQIGVNYLDGLGHNLQGQALEEGTTVSVTATVYDSLFRPAVSTKPAILKQSDPKVLSYRSDAVTSFDEETGIMEGAISDALPEDQNYPYSRKVFEHSPLSRPLKVGSPGKEFAITGSADDHVVTYHYGLDQQGELEPPVGKYSKTTQTDQNGKQQLVSANSLGQTVLSTIKTESGAIQNATVFTFKNTGQIHTKRLANYYKPPSGSVPSDWQRQSFYNTRQQLLWSKEPNSGTVNYVYNSDGLPRFSQNEEQAKQGIVAYRKYDLTYQITEEGYFYYPWNRSNLEAKATNEPSWPDKQESIKPYKKYYYSGDKKNPHNLGLLTKVEVIDQTEPAQPAVIVETEYNDQRLVEKTTTFIPKDNQTLVTQYQYNNLGYVTKTLYPSGFSLSNLRDEVGRVKEILGSDGKKILSLTYDAGDRILTETNYLTENPSTTTYRYNPQGWKTEINSPQFNQKLTYTSGGYQNTGYYNGCIASQEITLQVPEGSNLPPSLTFRYRYDAAYRGTVLACYQDSEIVDQWSLGVNSPITYDQNGNFLSVDKEEYRYDPGTDFVINNNGGKQQDFTKDQNGATIGAIPRGINHIERNIFSGKPDSIETQSHGTIDLTYGAQGLRVLKQVNDKKQYYGRHNNGSLLTQKNEQNGLTETKDFLYGPSGIFGLKKGKDYYAVQKDNLNAPRVLIDAKGKVISSYQYEPFGSLIEPSESNVELLNYLFGGYELEPETGIYNAGARLYDPQLRRFYGVDPQLQFASAYVFNGNNPMNLVDPSGEISGWEIFGGMIAGIGVGLVTGGLGYSVLMATAIGDGAIGAAAGTIAIGAVSGMTGNLAGDGLVEACEGKVLGSKSAGIDILSGLLSGAVGSSLGIGSASLGLEVSIESKATTLGVIGALTTVANTGVSSSMEGHSFFSKETAVSMAVGFIGGIGSAMLGNNFGVVATEKDFYNIRFLRNSFRVDNDQKLYCIKRNLPIHPDNTTCLDFINEPGYPTLSHCLQNNPVISCDEISIHSIIGYVDVEIKNGITRKMGIRTFCQYIKEQHYTLDGAMNNDKQTMPLAFTSCFAGDKPAFGKSNAQIMATALGRRVHATSGMYFGNRTNRTTLNEVFYPER